MQQQQQQQQIADAQIKELVAQINGQQIKIATLEETIKSNMSMVERLIAAQTKVETKDKKPLIQAKHCTPWQMTKTEQWKQWKEEIQDYSEEVNKGMKEVLKKVAECEEVANQTIFEE